MARARSIVQRNRIGTDQVTKELLEKKRIGFASIAALFSNSEAIDPMADDASAAGNGVQAM